MGHQDQTVTQSSKNGLKSTIPHPYGYSCSDSMESLLDKGFCMWPKNGPAPELFERLTGVPESLEG